MTRNTAVPSTDATMTAADGSTQTSMRQMIVAVVDSVKNWQSGMKMPENTTDGPLPTLRRISAVLWFT